MNEIELKPGDGVYIDGVRIYGLTDIKIDSSVDNHTELTFKMYAKVKGLDDMKSPYEFKNEAGE